MKQGHRPRAEQAALTLRQIEVQTTQGKSIAVGLSRWAAAWPVAADPAP
ncbi:hypothetical protein OCOJLMKI_5227 [Methylobacterium iners]|uniref:Uncharacterized protein n=1 Tax=Methylobacterium iners TaxID=418707 RepID=A0ABQ4S4D5_9HYPH|nr:hypothetical protein OCOJLMKI_5227 [Methylobacterium iners]